MCIKQLRWNILIQPSTVNGSFGSGAKGTITGILSVFKLLATDKDLVNVTDEASVTDAVTVAEAGAVSGLINLYVQEDF